MLEILMLLVMKFYCVCILLHSVDINTDNIVLNKMDGLLFQQEMEEYSDLTWKDRTRQSEAPDRMF